MLTTIEAEVDVNGKVTLLEPIRITKKSRAIITLLEDENAAKPEMSEREAQAAEDRFAQWIGSVDSGNPDSANNEQIDVDLVWEYGATHDDER